MVKNKILLIEDDPLASEFIYTYLSDCDFKVDVVFTATDGIASLRHGEYALAILDLNLPDFNGYEIIKSVRGFSSIPIIVTSAFTETKSKVVAFKYGANDYMVKPIDLEELEARIWVHLSKRSAIKSEVAPTFEIKDQRVYFHGELLDLTTIEQDILKLLIENKNQTLTREFLVESLSSLSSHRSLDNHIKNIRKKIGDNGSLAQYLKTEYGVGYKLVF
jgi:DNA-binding response OmpR family regulator